MAIASKSVTVGQLLRKYSLVILFPSFTVGSIYADYSHTQRWKVEKSFEKTVNNNVVD